MNNEEMDKLIEENKNLKAQITKLTVALMSFQQAYFKAKEVLNE